MLKSAAWSILQFGFVSIDNGRWLFRTRRLGVAVRLLGSAQLTPEACGAVWGSGCFEDSHLETRR